jgi:protein required for attachment to host cells
VYNRCGFSGFPGIDSRLQGVMMNAARTWIVIADGARARIAVNVGPGKGLEPALTHDFSAPRLHTSDLVSDRPGSYPDGASPSSHRVQPRTDRHDYEKSLFVRDVATAVEKGANGRSFDRLVLVAPPAILGKLRTALQPRIRAMVAAEVGKDLTHLSLRDLPQRLADVITL